MIRTRAFKRMIKNLGSKRIRDQVDVIKSLIEERNNLPFWSKPKSREITRNIIREKIKLKKVINSS